MRVTRVGPVAGMVALFAGCASNPAPSGWLPPAEVAAVEAFGGWITVDTAAGRAASAAEIAGELIAVHPDSVFVLSGNTLVAVPRARVASATLFAYDAQWGKLSTWGAVGTLLAVSNGWFFVLTGPTWIITSTIAAGSRSRAPMVSLGDQGGWDGLRLYARFPQGLPAGLDRGSLRPRAPYPASRAGSP